MSGCWSLFPRGEEGGFIPSASGSRRGLKARARHPLIYGAKTDFSHSARSGLPGRAGVELGRAGVESRHKTAALMTVAPVRATGEGGKEEERTWEICPGRALQTRSGAGSGQERTGLARAGSGRRMTLGVGTGDAQEPPTLAQDAGERLHLYASKKPLLTSSLVSLGDLERPDRGAGGLQPGKGLTSLLWPRHSAQHGRQESTEVSEPPTHPRDRVTISSFTNISESFGGLVCKMGPESRSPRETQG